MSWKEGKKEALLLISMKKTLPLPQVRKGRAHGGGFREEETLPFDLQRKKVSVFYNR